MTKRKRTILFLICLSMFLLAAPSTVLYIQGYRFDFETKSITQTGGLFLKAYPKQANIYIDGKIKEKTDFFFGSVLIENLIPKEYKVEAKKEGFHSWEKNLEIKKNLVAEAKNIILFPQNIEFSAISENIENAWISPDQSKIILKENKSNWLLKIFEAETSNSRILIKETDISKKGIELIDLQFNSNENITLEIKNKGILQYFSLSLNQTSPTPKEAKGPLKEEFIFNDYRFSKTEKTLSLYNKENKKFEKIFGEMKGFSLSPDEKKIAYFSNNEIWLLFLENTNGIFQKKAGENMFLMRLSGNIVNCQWLNNDYLVFNTEDSIKITEIDNRDKINMIDAYDLKNLPQSEKDLKLFWSQNSRMIYLLNDGNLYHSQKIFN